MHEVRAKCICDCELCQLASRLDLYASSGKAMSGEQVDQMEVGQLKKVINHTCVYYRVSPRYKLEILKVSSGEVPDDFFPCGYIYVGFCRV